MDGRFQISSPKPLEHQESTVETPMGAITYHTYFYKPVEDPQGNQWFSVSYCDYPLETIHSDSTSLLDDFFKETIKESAFSVNGEVRYEEPIDYNGLPGRFWRVDYLNGQATIKSRAFLIANRFYVIQVVSLASKSGNPDVQRFLEGFRLLVGG